MKARFAFIGGLASIVVLAALFGFSGGGISTMRRGRATAQSFGIVSSAEAQSAASPLPLPDVPVSELAVDPSGVGTVADYAQYFALHSKDIPFNGKKFSTSLKNKSGVALFQEELVQKALADHNFSEVHSSLATLQEFITDKIAFEKAIRVTSDGISMSQRMIGFDMLTQTLIQKAFDAEQGLITSQDVQNYYDEYLATAYAQHASVADSLALANHPVTAVPLLGRLFGVSTASAGIAGDPPFGGLITDIELCDCDAGYLVDVSPPVPVTLFVPFGFLGSPLFYEYRDLDVGVWWLGLYSGGTVPCLVWDGDSCDDIGQGHPIIMTGTSGGGGGTGGGGGGGGGGGSSGGSCAPITDPNSPCSVDNLSKTCMDGNALAASEICHAESGGDPFACGDKTTSGFPVSCGLYQINLTVHSVGGLDCPSAFDSSYTGSHKNVNIVNPTLYDQCVKAAQDPANNIAAACSISKNGTNWSQWSTASKCHV